MVDATVFVDDAVLGRLPPICVRTGEPADSWLLFEKPVGGMGAGAWVLLLLGPFGWLALAILGSLGTGREVLKVKLPYSQPALERYRARRRVVVTGWVVAVACIVAGLFLSTVAVVVVGVAALIVALIFQVVVAIDEVDIELDGSRRWVTLRGVDERFARAVEAAQESRGTAPA